MQGTSRNLACPTALAPGALATGQVWQLGISPARPHPRTSRHEGNSMRMDNRSADSPVPDTGSREDEWILEETIDLTVAVE